jgi:hypothetical protein
MRQAEARQPAIQDDAREGRVAGLEMKTGRVACSWAGRGPLADQDTTLLLLELLEATLRTRVRRGNFFMV